MCFLVNGVFLLCSLLLKLAGTSLLFGPNEAFSCQIEWRPFQHKCRCNFLPAVAARKFTPEEMAVTYAQAANGGRIGFSEGGEDLSNDPNYQGWKKIYEVNKDAASMNENHKNFDKMDRFDILSLHRFHLGYHEF